MLGRRGLSKLGDLSPLCTFLNRDWLGSFQEILKKNSVTFLLRITLSGHHYEYLKFGRMHPNVTLLDSRWWKLVKNFLIAILLLTSRPFSKNREKKKLNCSNSAVHLTKKLFFTNLKQFHTLS